MTDTIVVACKLPNGFILQRQKKTTVRIAIGGGRMHEEEISQADGEGFTLKGPIHLHGHTPQNLVQGGYVLNYGVPAKLWYDWCEQNKGCALLTNNILFAAPDREEAEAEARDKASFRSGLEPLDMSMKMVDGRMRPADPRVPRHRSLQLETAIKDK